MGNDHSATKMAIQQRVDIRYAKGREILMTLWQAGVKMKLVAKNEIKMSVSNGEMETAIVFNLDGSGIEDELIDNQPKRSRKS